MENKILSKEDSINIIKKNNKISNFEFLNAEWTPLSKSEVQGYMGDYYILKIKYQIKETVQTINVFVKTLSKMSAIQEKLCAETNIYAKEIYFYANLLDEFEKLGFCTNFAPKHYYSKNNDTLVLENLVLADYIQLGSKTFFDYDHCKVSIEALALFHANSIAFEESKTTELGRTYRFHEEVPKEIFEENYYTLGRTNEFMTEFISVTKQCFVEISKLIGKPKEWELVFEAKLTEMNFAKLFHTSLPFRRTCGHGDLWVNNMLFKYDKGIPIMCCLVDFQLLRYHHSAYDVLLLLYANTRRNFRKQHLNELLNYYYDMFKRILKNYGLEADNLLPKSHFLKAAEIFKPCSLFQGILSRSTRFLPEDIAKTITNILELLVHSDARIEIAIKAFKTDETYRNIILDDLFDLDEIL